MFKIFYIPHVTLKSTYLLQYSLFILYQFKTIFLQVKERPDVGVYVKDLHQFSVKNAQDMDKIMTVSRKIKISE